MPSPADRQAAYQRRAMIKRRKRRRGTASGANNISISIRVGGGESPRVRGGYKPSP